ncbi:MAG: hypothetical protein A2521_07525 [Deltaproteobacteria bacterium RIFOXYD12_FULL_57_12]|nr:MAG: hypothetical protein A2521_07525 [Deltaproteobacteria bacterium RIFOXYD12_FULL_57_12]
MPAPSVLPAPETLLANVAIVLKEPKYPENIGAAARIAMNMGIPNIVLVRAEEPDREKMLKLATHNGEEMIDRMTRYPSLVEALAPFSHVVGTSARQGRKRRLENTPRDIVPSLVPLLKNNKVALLFGPEDRGLTNDDLKFCQQTVTIPTADFSSLNLAQAVTVLCYELFTGILQSNLPKARPAPKLADSHELEGMYAHVEELLVRIGFLKTADTTYWMRNIRQFLGRVGLRSKEARIIRGFCRQFLWHEKQDR